MNDGINLVRIKTVHAALEELAKEFVFVGGATVSLYADRPTSDIRPTDDVDILIELLDYKGYSAIEEKLRSKGFHHDAESGVICRYQVQGIVVDVMPTSKEILGFTNRWYEEAIQHCVTVNIGEEYDIRIFTAAYFLATKLEAFADRGEGDGRFSTDFEDIVYLLNNRSVLWKEIGDAPENLQSYLRERLTELAENPLPG